MEATAAVGAAWMSRTFCGMQWHSLERLMLLCVVHTDVTYLSGPAKWGVGDNCKLIIILCSQIDEDKRRDTTQRLRQGKYDKKVTCLQCPHSLPWLRRALSGRRLFLSRDNSTSPNLAKWLDLMEGISHLFHIRCFAFCLLTGGKIFDSMNA